MGLCMSFPRRRHPMGMGMGMGGFGPPPRRHHYGGGMGMGGMNGMGGCGPPPRRHYGGGGDKEAGEGLQVVVMAVMVVMVVMVVAGDPGEDLVEAEDEDAKVNDDYRESWSQFSKMSSFIYLFQPFHGRVQLCGVAHPYEDPNQGLECGMCRGE
ncbi:hypothetical protein N7481_008363 [Penicillium waksmanii]|uniref:uncharacterized protein n=1 Tax=Penicillium waksmanii TaxID=69791 RepID=UPI002547F32D|nr:uncharacterized protein N7481_008363 [Penicillium waksmanii]KAJ5981065.1 hypothetical protein N7481_008363 [Penicillium waksmanii]